MIAKLFAAAALLSAPVAASAPITYDHQRQAVQYPLIHQVRCSEGSGTAFRVGRTRFLSVAHVTAMHNCTIDNWPVTVVEQDTKNDFSIVEAGLPTGGALKINCGGFHTSEWYWSAGYAFGWAHQTDVAIFSTAFNQDNGMHVFIGQHTVIPGMSGGPVMNAAGEVVGTTNAYNPFFGLSFSRALRDTSVCKP